MAILNQQSLLAVKKRSPVVAVVLSLLFGSFGLFYASVFGGIVMTVVALLVGLLAYAFGSMLIFKIGVVAIGISCIIWSVIAVNNSNKGFFFAQFKWEIVFRRWLRILSAAMLLLAIGVLITLIINSIPSIKSLGISYLWGKVWDPVQNIYGAYPFLIGTLLTSFIALFISIPFSFAIAIYLGEYSTKGWLSNLLRNTVELIAAVPSIIYGFWGFFVLVPIIRSFEIKIHVLPYGLGIFASSLILAVMVIPYAASLGATLIRMVPAALKEGAYGLGATRFEVIRKVIMPYTRSGLFAGVLLSLGRALGETMAVTLLIGNTSAVPHSIFALGNTMASVIANEFTEADHTIYLSALIELGLILFLVTVVINYIGKRIITRFTRN
ncbi:MAG TPA: phosphate ABC transporter permease subunit PstC [Mucilaginibacter sp.]|nr:phosphate ABC transporter permease subunit PstC [Mucilaginibacter sp.]